MRRILVRSVGVVVLGIFALTLQAQWTPCTLDELMQGLEKNRNKYTSLGDLRVRYDVSTFVDASDPQPVEEIHGRMLCAGAKYRSEMPGYLTIQDGRIRMVLDSAAKQVLVAPMDSAYLTMSLAYSREVFEGARAIGAQQTLMGKAYRVMFKDGADLEALEITFDGRGWLRRTVAYWRSGVADQSLFKAPKLVTDLAVPSALERSVVSTAFDTHRFIVLEKGSYRLTSALSDYELVDTRIP